MNLSVVLVIIGKIVLLYITKEYHCKNIYTSNKQTFYNLAVIKDHIYIGGKVSLIQLNRSLDVVNDKPLNGQNWLLSPYSTPEGIILISCIDTQGSGSECKGYNTANLSDVLNYNLGGIKMKEPVARYINYQYNVTSDILTIASSNCMQHTSATGNKCHAILLFHGKLKEIDVRYGVQYKHDVFHFKLDFKTVVVNGKFLYFLYALDHTVSKLGKLCTDFAVQGQYNTYEDLPIICTLDGVNLTSANDAMFWKDDLLVAFASATANVICRFKNVLESFKNSRIKKLSCPYNGDNQYFDQPEIFACYNSTSNFCKTTEKKDATCTEVTNDFCNTTFFGSVEGNLPMVGKAVYSQNLVFGTIVKMKDIIKTEKFIVIHVGTNTGWVGKIFINETNGFSTEDFKIVEKWTPVIDIKTVEEDVYVMTAKKIVNVGNTKDCPQSGVCEECMKSQNPFCGWDVLQNRCNKYSNQSFWVPSAGKQCFKLIPKDVIAKDDIGSNNPDSKDVNFKVEPDVLFPTNDKPVAECTVNGENVRVQYVGSSYKCQSLNFYKSGPANMSLMYNEILVVNATVNVYKCPDFESCNKCVQGRDCYWCPKTFFCTTNAKSCDSAIRPNNETMCPRIHDSEELFITENSVENVTVQVPNFGIYNDSVDLFKCDVDHNMYDATADRDNVNCINVASKTMQNKEAVLSLLYNSSHKLDNIATLKVYKCQSLTAGKNCGYCKYLQSKNYKCDWCQTTQSCESTLSKNTTRCSDQCIVGDGMKLKVSPPSGPINGGTVITITGQNIGNPGDNISVNIYGAECTPVNVIQPSEITCTTGKFISNNTYFNISVNGRSISYPAADYYEYEEPVPETSLNFTPDRCILSGGRRIFITGDKNYFNDANDSRFKVSFCNNTNSCINCSHVKSVANNRKTITCKMEKSGRTMDLINLTVIVDSNTILNQMKPFTIVTDPTIDDLSPESAKVFRSGGSKITITGQGFSNIGEVTMENVVTPCNITSDTSVVCATPSYVESDFRRRRRATGQNVQIKYDDYVTYSTIYYVDDPSINEFLNTIDYTAGSSIVITGQNLLEGAKKDEYLVHVGLSGLCVVEDVNSENITCQPPDAVPRTNHSDANIVYVLVQVGLIRRHVGFLRYSTKVDGPLTIILISVLSAVVAGAIFMVSAVIFIMRRKKKIAEKNFQMELLTREETIRQASREEFADVQMTIRDIKSDLVTSRVPFFDYQTYVFNQLFPNQDINKHPLLQEPMSTDDSKYRVQEALVMFDKLMTNKLFLKSVVQTLENQKGLSMQDKAHFACTLSVAFLGNMRLFYELVSCLLSDMIQSAPKKQHKVLFRRFDSITQRLMVNWLELSLYDHLKKQSGMQLFMLYKATQTVIEKGPIDAVTNHCRNTLAEERLLKNRVECETLTLNIDLNGNSDNHYPVTVLDCDTITQVKHKCITAIYKNKPASEIPTPNELELEWHHGRSGKLILQDKDKISDRSNGMVRLNTLKHYLVKNGSEMALMYKELLEDEPELYENQIVANAQFSSPDYVKLLIPDSLDEKNQDLHQWHLSNLTDEEKSQDYEIGELFLNRLFHTKLILRDYIDVAFEGILDPESLSVPVQYFLCMIDKQAKAVGVDSTVVQSWKSECYATRVWASLISRPQILFDVVVPSHVEPCMDILKQVFIDIFTQDAQNVSKDSSTQKLLFFKDVPEYRKHVDLFFSRVKGVSDQEFWRAIDEISSVQSREIKFNRQATLHQLYNIVAKYKDEIIEGFGANDETKDLDFGNKLEKVSEKMEE